MPSERLCNADSIALIINVYKLKSALWGAYDAALCSWPLPSELNMMEKSIA